MHPFPVLCALLLVGSAANATDLYKWKDTNGVTHYTETPPQGRQYEARPIDARNRSAATAPPVVAAEPAECTAAKANLAMLNSKDEVMQDTDGDGKPDKRLDAQDRAAQISLAEAAIGAYCKQAQTPTTEHTRPGGIPARP